MRIIVGLGNPGREYAGTRHNLGFMVVDEIARRHGPATWKKRFRSEIGELFAGGQKIVLVKPQTYMNLSGMAVREAINWYHVDQDEVIIVMDDLDTPFASLRLREKGSAGGHNGLCLDHPATRIKRGPAAEDRHRPRPVDRVQRMSSPASRRSRSASSRI